MNTKILKKLGKKLKEVRQKNNLTQEELAEKIGIHPTYVGKLEAGKNNPSVMMIYKFSIALKIDIMKLFDFKK